jgi:hypothetical protein
MSFGQMSVGKMSVGKMSVGKMSVGKMSVGKMSVGKWLLIKSHHGQVIMPYRCQLESNQLCSPRNTNQRGSLSTVELLIKASCFFKDK